jgi:AmmeMemoRadiSam system protein B
MSGPARNPAVAGSFYPAQPGPLRAMVASLMEAAAAAPRRDELAPEAVLGLLVPHAGLVYSGALAALSWRMAGETAPSTIVLLGTDHQARARGVGVWTGGPWRTPICETPIDAKLALDIAALGPPFAADDEAHLTEHSLEVQMPLLAVACPDTRIVPLAVSPRLRGHSETGRLLGRLLSERREAGERILLVASSDMAHYPPADVCERADDELLEPLMRLDEAALAALDERLQLDQLPALLCGLCGIDPVRVALAALREMGAARGILLGAATSADAGGDPRRTVGYAAVAFV